MAKSDNILADHFADFEDALKALGQVARTSGHPTIKGTVRETFLREVIEQHIGGDFHLGKGDIVFPTSKRGDPRADNDIVVVKRGSPRLHMAGGVSAFLAESVLCTIEIKSGLQQSRFKLAEKRLRHDPLFPVIKRAVEYKQKYRQLKWIQPKILGIQVDPKTKVASPRFPAVEIPQPFPVYILSFNYNGDFIDLATRIEVIHDYLGVTMPRMPDTAEEKRRTPSPSIDGIFVLGRGFLLFDSGNFVIANAQDDGWAEGWWKRVDCKNGALLALFLSIVSRQDQYLLSTPSFADYITDAIRTDYGVIYFEAESTNGD